MVKLLIEYFTGTCINTHKPSINNEIESCSINTSSMNLVMKHYELMFKGLQINTYNVNRFNKWKHKGTHKNEQTNE